jgi:hypothetical protein
MYLCVLEILIFPVPAIYRLEFESILTVWYFLFFVLLISQPLLSFIL